jgi:hypothetical protein
MLNLVLAAPYPPGSPPGVAAVAPPTVTACRCLRRALRSRQQAFPPTARTRP